VSDAFESGYPRHNNRDNYPTVDRDRDGVPDEVDSNPNSWGSTMTFTLQNTDNDSAPNYLDIDSDNDGSFDLFEVGFLPPSFDTDMNGRVDGVDTDGDGIVERVDTCRCFGGLVVRKFNIISPAANARWLMYSTKTFTWSHNLLGFNAIRIDLYNTATKKQFTVTEAAIGNNNESPISKSWQISRINPGTYIVKIGLYAGSTFFPDVFSSSPFRIST